MTKEKTFTSHQICNMLGLGTRDRFAITKKYIDGAFDDWVERLKEIGASDKFVSIFGDEEE